MIEDYKKLYQEREEQNNNEYDNYLQNNIFNLSYINFDDTYKNLEEDRKSRENKLKDDNYKNISLIIDELKAYMRKDLYLLIDRANNKNNKENLIGKKRRADNTSFSHSFYSENHSEKNIIDKFDNFFIYK